MSGRNDVAVIEPPDPEVIDLLESGSEALDSPREELSCNSANNPYDAVVVHCTDSETSSESSSWLSHPNLHPASQSHRSSRINPRTISEGTPPSEEEIYAADDDDLGSSEPHADEDAFSQLSEDAFSASRQQKKKRRKEAADDSNRSISIRRNRPPSSVEFPSPARSSRKRQRRFPVSYTHLTLPTKA